MIIYIIKNGKIESFILPQSINGSYWIFDTDSKGEKRSLVNVTTINNNWQINSNSDAKIYSGSSFVNSALLTDYSYFSIVMLETNETILLYCCPGNDKSYKPYVINSNTTLSIGRANNNTIIYDSPLVRDIEAKLSYENDMWTITAVKETTNIYVNKEIIVKKQLYPADIVFLMGLKIICMGEFIVLNNPLNKVTINPLILQQKLLPNIDNIEIDTKEDSLDDDDVEYFFRAPRFRTKIEPIEITIDPPPGKIEEAASSALATIGPMVTMGLIAIISLLVAVNDYMSSKSIINAMPSFGMAISMITMSIIWPVINSKFQNKIYKRRENLRQEKYTNYINKKANEIKNIISVQRNILIENNIPVEECQSIIVNKKRNLWERKIEHDDFLKVRLGTGVTLPKIKINYPEEQFTLFDDNLLEYARKTIGSLNEITNVPVSISFVEKFIAAVVGNNYNMTKEFIDLLILQIVALQSYEDLKLVILTSEKNCSKWEYLKMLPHCWNNANSARYFATNIDEIKQVSNLLETEFNERLQKYLEKANTKEQTPYKEYSPYYLIITDNIQVARNSEIVKKILSQKQNIGFSILFQSDKLSDLPNECFSFISIDKASCGVFENDLVSDKQSTFVPITSDNINFIDCYKQLANIPIKLENVNELPKTISFLEMYEVGNISQLNILNKWKKNNPSISLGVPIGVDESRELFKLDLHEKFHGPHGLIAGMTGSGKSEFIVTYILSLAVNFCPDEVSFVIIDYKGGGLAGAFYNKETGIKLPHLVGTITNLDTAEMNRSIASIDSELKRRQILFNETRDKFNESTIDIYKYQRMYREKKVTVPLPHLFIISDEFAELKTQQPDFMNNLMSIARIGRSLGVHLILATQKPSGVVNEQIWSNSKFRVCLKVQDRSDSMDMIKREDAANLKDVGRFYLQVGYNELFKLGQSAWCGTNYIESDKLKKNIDTSLSFVDNTGYIVKSIDTDNKKDFAISKGDELTNLVSYLNKTAKELNIEATPLWLDTLPAYINIKKLEQKYNYKKEDFNVNLVIGEYDIPDKQKQNLLTLPILDEGNIAIYGINGSGKEELLTTLIYSAITNYTVDELNFYVIDYGAETLKMFSNTPHVGDVVLSDDDEKTRNLFKFIKNELIRRKKIFSEYNGDYKEYCKNSGSTVPTIVIILNNLEAFLETYLDYEEALIALTRDCTRFGISFVITSNTTTGLRYRMRQNFKTEYVLRLTDPSDYSYLLSLPRKMEPAKLLGRGLVAKDSVYEFQTASIIEDESKINDIIKELNEILNTKYKKAEKIPVLPGIVTLELVSKDLKGLSSVPIGIDTEKLTSVNIDIKGNTGLLFVSKEIENFKHFLPLFIEQVKNIQNNTTVIIDANASFEELAPLSNNYYKDNFDVIFNSLNNYIDKVKSSLEANNNDSNILQRFSEITCFIICPISFKEKLNDENKEKFNEFIEKISVNSKIHIIIIDNLNDVKDLEYESWFTNIIKLNNAIWVGNSINDQMTIKISSSSKDLSQEIANNFGYYVKNGDPIQLKLIYDSIEELNTD